jgi:hypothetical protein
LAASKIQSGLLETLGVSTWEELVEYLRDMKETTQNVNQCAKDVKEICRTTLVRLLYWMKTIQLKNFQFTIEAEPQSEFFEGIKELREIHDTVISATARGSASIIIGFETTTHLLALSGRAQTVTRSLESTVTSVGALLINESIAHTDKQRVGSAIPIRVGS